MGSTFGGTWEDPGGVFFQIRSKKSIKTRPNISYGIKISSYSIHTSAGGDIYGMSLLKVIVAKKICAVTESFVMGFF